LAFRGSTLKDDLDEIAMCGRRRKPSSWSIAAIFAAAAVLGYLLFFTPRTGPLSGTHMNPASSRAK
jgi:glycerol uptake facilitator-like aquaporin